MRFNLEKLFMYLLKEMEEDFYIFKFKGGGPILTKQTNLL